MQAKFAAKLTAVFGLTTICITTLVIGLLYTQSRSAIHREIEAKLIDVALSSAQAVDPTDHAHIRKPGDSKGRHYKRVLSSLQRLRKANPRIIRAYTLVASSRRDNHHLKFIMDVGASSTPTAYVGCPFNATNYPEIRNAFFGATADMKAHSDRRGSWLSAYAPIKDRSGHIVAVLGIDTAADYILHEERKLGVSALLAFCTAVALSILLSVVASSRVAKPVRQLMDATRHVAEGNMDYTIATNRRDEIGELARSFNQMVSALKESQNKLMKRANTDGLTGLYNHRYFQERIGQELKRATRYGRTLALIMMDVDGFKLINDTLGHPAGDTILRKISETIQESIRDIDIATRYGGDEFAIILPETDQAEAVRIAERIRDVVNERISTPDLSVKHAGNLEKTTCHATLSIGIAVCPKHARHRDSLLAAADIAMYHAKHVSQNAVCTYDNVPGAGGSMDPCRIHTFLQSASVATIAALATAVDAKDHYTKGHSENVAKYAAAIADEFRLSDEDKFSVRIAALLHDVGKIGTPDNILKQNGALTGDQRDIIRNHPSIGESIVKQVPQLQRILPGILYHHERFDGHGYPCGLPSTRIPMLARIICVADAFDAMTSDRPYRQAMGVKAATAELRRGAGTQFDPQVVDAFIRWVQTDAQQLPAA